MKDRIRQIRGKKTAIRFAEELGVGRSTIVKWESGVTKPTGAGIKAICTKYGISEDWLLTGKGEMKASSEEDTFAQKLADELANGSEAFRSLIRAYMDLSDENKDVIDLFIRRLAAEMNGQPTVPDYTSLPVVQPPDEAAAE